MRRFPRRVPPGGALPGLAQGQETGRIVGRVTARETGAPISAAQVYLPVTAGAVAEANFQLATEALGLDEIVMTGTAGAARRREVGNTINQITVARHGYLLPSEAAAQKGAAATARLPQLLAPQRATWGQRASIVVQI